MVSLVSFFPANDKRVIGTLKAIETHLAENGFVARCTQDPAVDGLLTERESFWPVSGLHLLVGR